MHLAAVTSILDFGKGVVMPEFEINATTPCLSESVCEMSVNHAHQAKREHAKHTFLLATGKTLKR